MGIEVWFSKPIFLVVHGAMYKRILVVFSVILLSWPFNCRARINSGRALTGRQNVVRPRETASRAVVARTAVGGVATTRDDMEQLANFTEYCRTQYTSCMDNFCNVLDEAQGRCSCSANLKNYAKTEGALKNAAETLRDITQQIQYIGLTAGEIDALFKQTEAEQAIQQKSDNTQLKNSLDSIRNMIVDVKSGTAASVETGIGADLSGLLDVGIGGVFTPAPVFDFSAPAASIGNRRGADLYKTAAARCKASVLNNCTARGVDAGVLINAYDLEIDRQCIAYERSLKDRNTEMGQMVRNAQSVLQKARLSVARQKNVYDLRGCINALDSCMQDDFVCGADYKNCLDPTGKYIVSGQIVAGADLGRAPVPTEAEISNYLRSKIGTPDSGGMCASVMLKCQNSVIKDGRYTPDNPLMTQYLTRTVPRIKMFRADVVNNYAASCVADVSACINQNGYSGRPDIAIGACMAPIRTCRSLTDENGGNDIAAIREWLTTVLGNKFTADNESDKWSGMDAFPDANVEISVGEDELNIMRRQDMDACLSIGNTKVSQSGAMCIVYGKNGQESEASVLARAKQAVSMYGGVVAYKVSKGQGQSEGVAKISDVHVYMYMMRFAYYQAKKECEYLGGTFRAVLGSLTEWPACQKIPADDLAQCKKYEHSRYPANVPERIGPLAVGSQSFYDDANKLCTISAHGAYFLGKDIIWQMSGKYRRNCKSK